MEINIDIDSYELWNSIEEHVNEAIVQADSSSDADSMASDLLRAYLNSVSSCHLAEEFEAAVMQAISRTDTEFTNLLRSTVRNVLKEMLDPTQREVAAAPGQAA